MSDPILKASTFKFMVDGVPFEMYRRSTVIMAKARGFQRVLGLIGGETAVLNGTAKFDKVEVDDTVTMIEGVLRAALVNPVMVDSGEEATPPKNYTFEQLAPFADAAFNEFMGSGLDAAPLPNSCEETTEPSLQDPSTS